MLPALVFVIRLQRQLVGLLWLKSHSSGSWLSSFAYQSVCFKSAIVRDARDPDFCMCLVYGTLLSVAVQHGRLHFEKMAAKLSLVPHAHFTT